VRIFKTKSFTRFARRAQIDDRSLCEAAARAERGLIDADLGSGLIKQRIARPGQGRSGGYRTLLAFRSKDRTIFVFGFAKSDQDNIDDQELLTIRSIAEAWLAADLEKIDLALAKKLLSEVQNDGTTEGA